ncbi:PREDICTED: sulfotransferase family cytosolic 1B member 1-like [Branchiostoma belcheri]|uniref:Sulfotransferase n=1 Tax=Branchiostoma belcheri TaxID=7741 RepID=A0A6P4YCD2_BRABE|nr:PREDICTED: sulfotransferase family cytosolic 1B member 1-like [Branchiostoma belcheri]
MSFCWMSPHKSHKSKTDALHEYRGVMFPRGVAREHLDAMPNFQTRDDDIAVVSYPKTGTTWMLEIVSRVLSVGGKADRTSEEIGRLLEATVPGTARPSHVSLQDMPSPRVITTHLPRQFVPPGLSKPAGKVKVLVVMRNPKDTAVSSYHFVNKTHQQSGSKAPLKWDSFSQEFLQGKAGWGSYFDHLSGWWQMHNDPHFLFIKYEDMKKDLRAAVKKVANFLEVSLDEDTLQDVVNDCTFGSMKANMAKSQHAGKKVLARKGVVGDWKQHFTLEQSDSFDAMFRRALGGTGLDFEYDEADGPVPARLHV